MEMDEDESSILFKLMKISLIRKRIINFIPSFVDINNLMNVCTFLKYDIKNEPIERGVFSYDDCQVVRITYDDDFEVDSGVPGLGDLQFIKDNHSLNLIDKLNTFFGEKLHNNNSVSFFINSPIQQWKEEDHELIIKKVVGELNLNCPVRRDVKNLKFRCNVKDNTSYIILDALSYMGHQNITKISLPVNCFTCQPNNYNKINGNIFNGFPNLTELHITSSLFNNNYYELLNHMDIFKKFVEQFSNSKNPIIFFDSLKHNDANLDFKFNEIISIMTRYQVKVKFNIDIGCQSYEGKCKNCTDPVEFFSPIKQYITNVSDTIRCRGRLFHSIKILETFSNLNTLNLNFTMNVITDQPYPAELGLKKLKNLKNVKLEFEKHLDESNSDIVKLLNNLLQFTCSIMPRNVKVLQIEHIPDLDDVTATIINQNMPNIKLLKINCLSYIESSSLELFKKLECLISYNYCPTKIPPKLKLLSFQHKEWNGNSKGFTFSGNVIKSYFEKFSKRIGDNENIFILFNNIHHWHLYKRAIQKYFVYV